MISVLRGQHQHIKPSTWRRVRASRESVRLCPSQPWAPSLRDEDCGLIYLAEWQEAERERETLPRRRYWSQLVWANTVTPAHHLTSNTGLHFTLNLYCELWLPCPNVTRQQAELHLASSRRLELLNLLTPHCSRQTISDHLPFLVQNNPTHFCTTLEVCVSPSGDWGRMLQVIFYFTETLNTPRWLQFTPCRRPGEGGGGRARLSLSRLPSQLNIPAPLHRGCAGVEQPLAQHNQPHPKYWSTSEKCGQLDHISDGQKLFSQQNQLKKTLRLKYKLLSSSGVINTLLPHTTHTRQKMDGNTSQTALMSLTRTASSVVTSGSERLFNFQFRSTGMHLDPACYFNEGIYILRMDFYKHLRSLHILPFTQFDNL